MNDLALFDDPDRRLGHGAEVRGPYRYRLWRQWRHGSKFLLWVMLNPSTADADVDDPTIRRCIEFSRRDGFDGLRVCNLFAWRATKPVVLRSLTDPVGEANDIMILSEAAGSISVVAAWGRVHRVLQPRADAVLHMLSLDGHAVQCLGRNADDSPRHPLYLAKSTPFVGYRP